MDKNKSEIERIAQALVEEGYIPPTIWQEERERVLGDLERIICGEVKEEPKMMRVRWRAPTASGGRTGWARTVEGIDGRARGAQAFLGQYIKDNVEIDLAINTVVVQVEPRGSVKNNWQSAQVGVVSPQGLLLEDVDYNWREEFLSFRDRVAELLEEVRGG